MSERGTFCTGFLYCPQCAGALREALAGRSEITLFPTRPEIIAGFTRITPGYAGEELTAMLFDWLPEAAKRVCMNDEVRLVMFPDQGWPAVFCVSREKVEMLNIIRGPDRG